MGGLVCHIQRNAILEYAAIPTEPKKMPEFDRQLRACFASGEIAAALEANGTGMKVCDILWKDSSNWTLMDRTELLNYLEALW